MKRYNLIRSVIDNSRSYHRLDSACPRLDRTISIRFTEMDGGFMVEAKGSGMPDWGSARYEGRLDADQTQIRLWVEEFLRSWHRDFVAWTDPSKQWGFRRTPATEKLDLSAVVTPAQLERIWRTLAVAGRKLFTQLFMHGDDGLKRLGRKLTDALWTSQHVITITSNEVIVPWSMLYVPRPDALSQSDTRLEVDRSAFLGYRHLVEHTFNLQRELQPDILYTRLSAGAYFDESLETTTVQPVLTVLDKHAATVRRGLRRADVEDHLRGVGAEDHLLYFCCHCVQAGSSAALRLTDGETISAGDLGYWLTDRSLQRNPLVVINACTAGEFGSHPPSHFGTVLFERGASSLVGPSVNIPGVVAKAFAEELFDATLSSRLTFGQVVWGLMRDYADLYHNPLGLSYSLFHGIDGHFCLVEGSDRGAASAKD